MNGIGKTDINNDEWTAFTSKHKSRLNIYKRSKHEVVSSVKPEAKFHGASSESLYVIENMERNDYTVLLAGTNDVSCNEIHNR